MKIKTLPVHKQVKLKPEDIAKLGGDEHKQDDLPEMKIGPDTPNRTKDGETNIRIIRKTGRRYKKK